MLRAVCAQYLCSYNGVYFSAYCINMLNNELIRWEDFSLVVLDEVHHCNKGHPYQKLISNYHRVLPEASRAKILGLTASPAGKSTVELTYSMLCNLLNNLGEKNVCSMYIGFFNMKGDS